MYPHRIHLHGPWDCAPLERTALTPDGRIEPGDGPAPPRRRMNIPCSWSEGGLGPFAGRVRFHRRFHWPGRLDYYERLWLVFEGVDYFANAFLNGAELGRHEGAFDSFEFDVTPLIGLKNDLNVEVNLPAESAGSAPRLLRDGLPPDSGGIWGSVALEVRREAFLRDLRLWATFEDEPKLHVAGQAPPSDAARSYELYVLLDGSTVLYRRLPGAGPFHEVTDTPGIERWQPRASPRLYDVRVELTDGAGTLDSRRFSFGFRTVEGGGGSPVLVNGRLLGEPPARFELRAPVASANIDDADREGVALWLKLPAPAGLVLDSQSRPEVFRQVCAIVGRLQAHPAIIGWLCAGIDKEIAGELGGAVRQLDPTRPFEAGRVKPQGGD